MRGRRDIFTLSLFLSLVAASLSAEGQQEQMDLVLWDGFESYNQWKVSSPSGKSEVYTAGEHSTEGRRSLKVVLSPEDKGGDSGDVLLKRGNVNMTVDWIKKVVVDVYNNGAPFDMALGIHTDSWAESIPKRVNKGLNKNITFELNVKDFKFPIDNKDVIKDLVFIVYPNQEADLLYFDNVRIKQRAGLESVGFTPSLGSLTAQGYSAPEAEAATGPYSITSGRVPSEEAAPISEHKTIALITVGLVGLFLLQKYIMLRG